MIWVSHIEAVMGLILNSMHYSLSLGRLGNWDPQVQVKLSNCRVDGLNTSFYYFSTRSLVFVGARLVGYIVLYPSFADFDHITKSMISLNGNYYLISGKMVSFQPLKLDLKVNQAHEKNYVVNQTLELYFVFNQALNLLYSFVN